MQQPGLMFPVMPSFPSTNITTEQIQKYLDENKKLILAILDNQNLGKLHECAQYQAQLQKNLMYLAALADAQPPQTPAVPAQIPSHPHPAMHQGGFYMQHPQAVAAAMTQQPGLFPPRAPFSSLHPLQDPQLQTQPHAQTATHAQIAAAMRPVGQPNNAINSLHNNDINIGRGGSSSVPNHSNAASGGNKQDKPDAGSDGQVNAAAAHVSGNGDQQAK